LLRVRGLLRLLGALDLAATVMMVVRLCLRRLLLLQQLLQIKLRRSG
jgi:hypothetical protein